MSTLFIVKGLKVRCIDATDSANQLIKGEIYTIHQVGADGCFYQKDGSGWAMDRFEEIEEVAK
jgi:hypothetical protein